MVFKIKVIKSKHKILYRVFKFDHLDREAIDPSSEFLV